MGNAGQWGSEGQARRLPLASLQKFFEGMSVPCHTESYPDSMTNNRDVTPAPQRTLTRSGSVCVSGRMEIEKAQIIDRLAAAAGQTRSEYVRHQLEQIIEANTRPQGHAPQSAEDYETARRNLHEMRRQLSEGTTNS